jgi:hypothetical protein
LKTRYEWVLHLSIYVLPGDIRHEPYIEDWNSCRFSYNGILEDLLHEFCEYVVKPRYPGGISEAIMDLMKKAMEE